MSSNFFLPFIILFSKYFDINTEDLSRKLDSELGGSFEALIVNCMQADEEEFDEEYHNEDKMNADAEMLYEMGQGSFGTDEKGFFKLLVVSCSRRTQRQPPPVCVSHGFLQQIRLHQANT